MRYQITLVPADDEPFVFYAGMLEPGEVGSIIVAAMKRMRGEPPGWSVHIMHILEAPEGEP